MAGCRNTIQPIRPQQRFLKLAEGSAGATAIRCLPMFPVGKTCKVQFKRNALGGGATLPIPPITDSINGADVSLSGTLKSVEGRAIIVVSGKRTYWIPKDSILLVVSEE